MRVLQLSKYYDPVSGGIELVARMMSKAFIEGGHQVDVIAFSDKNLKRIGRYNESVEEIKQDLFLISTPMSFKFFFRFKELILKNTYDRIYVHLPNPYMHEVIHFYQKEIRSRGIKVIGVYHSDILNKGFLGTAYQAYFKSTHYLYDEIICSSPKLISSSSTLNALPASKMKVIPFCVDETGGFQQRKKFRGHLIAIGRMVPYKGFKFLIDAINDSPYKLTIIGTGPLFSELKRIAGPNVNLIGQVSDAEKEVLLSESDVLVVSSNSRAEAYGMTIVEAFEKGLPVIASDINSGVTYLVSEQKTGLTFKINDKNEFLSKLALLSNDPALLENLSRNCHDFYQRTLSFKKFMSNLLS
jgi:glycosyltransferase involved in cell wall biosynthesis